MITTPKPRGRHAKSGRTAEPRVLLLSTADPDEAARTKAVLAKTLVTLNLAGEFGVFIAPCQGWHGVWLGRHDGQPIAPTAAVLRAAERLRQ